MTSTSMVLPDALRDFIDSSQWTFFRTMPEWPHEYIVREGVDENLFLQLAIYIRTNGYEGKFYSTIIIYYDVGGMAYWTTEKPVDDTIIINRCKKEDSYEYRRLKGTLPESKIITVE